MGRVARETRLMAGFHLHSICTRFSNCLTDTRKRPARVRKGSVMAQTADLSFASRFNLDKIRSGPQVSSLQSAQPVQGLLAVEPPVSERSAREAATTSWNRNPRNDHIFIPSQSFCICLLPMGELSVNGISLQLLLIAQIHTRKLGADSGNHRDVCFRIVEQHLADLRPPSRLTGIPKAAISRGESWTASKVARPAARRSILSLKERRRWSSIIPNAIPFGVRR